MIDGEASGATLHVVSCGLVGVQCQVCTVREAFDDLLLDSVGVKYKVLYIETQTIQDRQSEKQKAEKET